MAHTRAGTHDVKLISQIRLLDRLLPLSFPSQYLNSGVFTISEVRVS